MHIHIFSHIYIYTLAKLFGTPQGGDQVLRTPRGSKNFLGINKLFPEALSGSLILIVSFSFPPPLLLLRLLLIVLLLLIYINI